MTRKVITLLTAGVLTLGSFVYLEAKGADEFGHGPKHWHHMMGNPLDSLSDKLDLTADQKAKVQPIIDQTKPQLQAIHKEAMEKMRATLENAGAQIRPLLTPEQQAKFDQMKQAHQKMCDAMKEMHDAESQ